MKKTDRLKVLLEKGYFPAELPPPFNTVQFAKFRTSILAAWPNNTPPKSSPELYSIQRLGWKRRSLAIVNPISQYFLSKLISDEWVKIESLLNSSAVSLDKSGLKTDASRAVPKPDFTKIQFIKLKAGGDYDHILVSDISRFYGTIYTHTLPWAFEGKAWCKQHVNSALLTATIGDKLDRAVRKGQDNQTIGIPVGPDTSRILSEIIGVGVEREFLRLSGLDGTSAYRFVDDWFIGHNSAQEAETAIRHLSQASAEFELELNHEKTKVLSAREEIIESWPNELLDLRFDSRSTSEQSRQLNHFFSRALAISNHHPSDNVMDYALKIARSFNVRKEVYPLFESYVLRCARAFPITLPVVVQILANNKKDLLPVSLPRCRKLILDELRKSVPMRHTAEVAWVLFLAKALGISIPSDALSEISKADNAVWALITLDLSSRGLIDGVLDKSYWQSLMVPGSLFTSNWLLVYESDLKGWLTPADPNLVYNDSWFKVLKAKKVSFYDTGRNVESFKRSREKSVTAAKQRSGQMQSWISTLFTSTSLGPVLPKPDDAIKGPESRA